MGEPNPIGDNSIFGISYIFQPLLWEQWWSIDQLVSLGLSEDRSSTANGVYQQTGPLLDGFIYRSDTSSTDHWNDTSPVTDYTELLSSPGPVTKYTAPSSNSEDMVSEELPPIQGYWHPPSTPKKPSRKRKRDSNKLPPRSAARRSSSGDEGINPQKEKKVKHSTVRRKSNPSGNGAHLAQQRDRRIKVIQERNRIASNKLRVKKSEALLRLKSSEQDKERIHRDLSTCVADLTLEVYELKMQLLQQSGCNCALIQNYLVNESQQYVQALNEKPQREASARGLVSAAVAGRIHADIPPRVSPRRR
ncbi:hypothetical protein BGZ61DRAFT_500070 [Ilyonectria robusta]|uniref:uncharacterized protein n=1 Tax=Ilyonectria robusta TaxID=1079257 RepID=UPI001E8D6788|nr:uncharacterized protein BGZ61DRAFT_500070 [Ilyonectria robusta]KAH8657232.1 hypothetical protein BGZ61DRAFT_500070 [Ilyonectria robusta]